MSQQFEKLTADLLKKLFQLDRPDLDFGFYRIMHAKSEEITQFLERDLLPQVHARSPRRCHNISRRIRRSLSRNWPRWRNRHVNLRPIRIPCPK